MHFLLEFVLALKKIFADYRKIIILAATIFKNLAMKLSAAFYNANHLTPSVIKATVTNGYATVIGKKQQAMLS